MSRYVWPCFQLPGSSRLSGNAAQNEHSISNLLSARGSHSLHCLMVFKRGERPDHHVQTSAHGRTNRWVPISTGIVAPLEAGAIERDGRKQSTSPDDPVLINPNCPINPCECIKRSHHGELGHDKIATGIKC